jgi:hypothetical protein
MSVALAAVVSDASSVSADTSGVNCTPTAWPLCHTTRHHRLKLLESSSTNLSGNVFPGNGCGGPLGYFFSNLLGNPKVLERVGPHTQRETNERPSSDRGLRDPRIRTPRLDPDTKRPISVRDRGGWLALGIIGAIVVAGIAIYAFGLQTRIATRGTESDTTIGQGARTSAPITSIPGTAPRVNPLKFTALGAHSSAAVVDAGYWRCLAARMSSWRPHLIPSFGWWFSS